MTPTRLEAVGLSLAYDGRSVVADLDLAIPAGDVTAIIGPNGCGKSTLLRGLARLLPARGGEVLLDGAPLAGFGRRDLARRVSLLPQAPSAPGGLTVLELVARGRHPHQNWYGRFTPQDERIVREALAATGLDGQEDRLVDELSGGQRQRAWISMTLAQQTDTMLLDEPTTYLDVAHQLEVLELVRRLNRGHGHTVVMVLHDISLAARYADRIVAMRDGRVVHAGPPSEVVTPAILHEVFGIRAALVDDPDGGTPHVLPLGLPAQATPAADARAAASVTSSSEITS
ncbi:MULTISPECIES: ABC transporter ATP-binding protein [Microbacterium]|uniref:ABC transporter ATP-binding protein n=1 Tax=Microbacterium TaxID=33882 RepID=UPI00217F06B2|nr:MULTISPECIES: ABC transporter ATP-binding protein [Microbacterium]UWF76946.1 ABC transporter ATP-binding protein [Microbacterium neungamense]WCM55106.1 ABC transporter ATP-binding protein [Microbacterium sp. EF45047]